jgi:hypothetical protein
MKRILALLLIWSLLVTPCGADITFHGATGQTLYVRVQTGATTFEGVALTEGSSGGLGVYTVTDGALVSGGLQLKSGNFPYTIRTGTASDTVNDPIVGSGSIIWSGTAELPLSASAQHGVISTVTSQTDITIEASNILDDTYNGCDIIVYDVSASSRPCKRRIVDSFAQSGVAVRLELDAAPAFTMVVGDIVDIRWDRSNEMVELATTITGYLPSTGPISNFESATDVVTIDSASSASLVNDVWDEALSGHATAGTAGEALTDAGIAGDPWSTALPGAYGAGTAGKIVSDALTGNVPQTGDSYSLLGDPATFDDAYASSQLEADLAAVAAGVEAGGTISPSYVGPGHTFRFDSNTRLTANNTITETTAFDGLVRIKFRPPIADEVSIAAAGPVTIAPTVDDEPVLGTPLVTPDKLAIDVPVDCTAADAGTYTISQTITTTDGQTLKRTATLVVE